MVWPLTSYSTGCFFFYFLTQNTGDRLLSGHYGRLMAGRACWLLYHLLRSPFSSSPSPPCRDKVSALCSLLLQEKLDLFPSFNCQKAVFKVACTPPICCLPLLSEVKGFLADVFQPGKYSLGIVSQDMSTRGLLAPSPGC